MQVNTEILKNGLGSMKLTIEASDYREAGDKELVLLTQIIPFTYKVLEGLRDEELNIILHDLTLNESGKRQTVWL